MITSYKHFYTIPFVQIIALKRQLHKTAVVLGWMIGLQPFRCVCCLASSQKYIEEILILCHKCVFDSGKVCIMCTSIPYILITSFSTDLTPMSPIFNVNLFIRFSVLSINYASQIDCSDTRSGEALAVLV